MARSGWMPLTAAAAFAVGAAGMACTRSDNRAANDQNAMASPSPTATVTDNTAAARNDNDRNGPSAGDIASSPAKYEGQHVTLKSDVKQVMPNGLFMLDDHDTLVLSPRGAEPGEKENVTVSGTVETYSAPEFKRKYNFKSNREADAKFKDRAVIVADSIMTADGRDLLTAGSALPAGSGEPGAMDKGTGTHRRSGQGNTPADSNPPPQR